MAANDKKIQPIVIKRIKKAAHGHHGGAWKIAYADFVTAMMAFFLLMWLLGSTDSNTLKGIADHFNTPLEVAIFQGDRYVDSNTVIQGGGKDLARAIGTQTGGAGHDRRNLGAFSDEVRAEERRRERVTLESLKSRVEEVVSNTPDLEPLRTQMQLELTPDGLEIQLADMQNRPMFLSGSAVLQADLARLLQKIGGLLATVDRPVSLTGHTDSTRYSGNQGGYSNWELSAERANASRRSLVMGGMQTDKVIRVSGLADKVLRDPANPRNPVNRRIAIVVLNREAEERILHGYESQENQTNGAENAQRAPSQPAQADPAADTRSTHPVSGKPGRPEVGAPDSTNHPAR